MKMDARFIPKAILLALCPHEIEANSTTTPGPRPGTSRQMFEEDDLLQHINLEHARSAAVHSLFEGLLSRDEAKMTLKRALDMLEHRPQKEYRRGPDYDDEAKGLLRFMTGEEHIGSTSSESVIKSPAKASSRDDICEIEESSGQRRSISANTQRIIVEMHRRGASEAAIKAKYPWFRRNQVKRFTDCIEGSQKSRMEQINQFVEDLALSTIDARQPLHDYMIVRWALQKADELDARSFFSASGTWLKHFKKRARISSRKITDWVSKADRNKEDKLAEMIIQFQNRYAQESVRYPHRLIINVDQTAFQYEMYRDRTLARKGSRNVEILIGSHNKRTHSYTSQPMISRDGIPLGKILLCLQESSGKFGPRIEPRVRQLEEMYGNIRVFASDSGKMSSQLMREWIREVLIPVLNRRLRSVDTDTEIEARSQSSQGSDNVFGADPSNTTDQETHDILVDGGTEICRAVGPSTRCQIPRLPICLEPSMSTPCIEALHRLANRRAFNQPHTLLLPFEYNNVRIISSSWYPDFEDPGRYNSGSSAIRHHIYATI